MNSIFASFFFVDIVGLSNPLTTTETQTHKIEVLNNSIKHCESFRSTPKDSMLILPTGDGAVIGFMQWPEAPIKLAIELHDKLHKYNTKKDQSDKILIRVGIHSGPAYVIQDLLGNRNVWGPGIIIARRIMDLATDCQILLSDRVAEDLMDLSEIYKKILHPLGVFKAKHNLEVTLYYVRTETSESPLIKTEKRQNISPEIEIALRQKILKLVKMEAEKMMQETGVQSSFDDAAARKYLDEVVGEIKNRSQNITQSKKNH